MISALRVVLPTIDPGLEILAFSRQPKIELARLITQTNWYHLGKLLVLTVLDLCYRQTKLN